VNDEERLAGLLGRSFRTCAGPEANRAIDEVRHEWARRVGRAFSYEIVLGADRSWPYLRDFVTPRLALFLRSKRMRVDACAPVFLPIFAGETVHFVGAAEFLDYYRALEELSPDGLAARARGWEEGP
jgi:hypothetical protein